MKRFELILVASVALAMGAGCSAESDDEGAANGAQSAIAAAPAADDIVEYQWATCGDSGAINLFAKKGKDGAGKTTYEVTGLHGWIAAVEKNKPTFYAGLPASAFKAKPAESAQWFSFGITRDPNSTTKPEYFQVIPSQGAAKDPKIPQGSFSFGEKNGNADVKVEKAQFVSALLPALPKSGGTQAADITFKFTLDADASPKKERTIVARGCTYDKDNNLLLKSFLPPAPATKK